MPDDQRRLLMIVGAIVLVVAIIGGVVIAGGSSDKAEAGEVLLEPVTSDGPFPWTGTLVPGNAPTSVPLPTTTVPATTPTTPTTAATSSSGPTAIAAVRGDRVGIYGGTTQLSVCDKKKLVSFLEQNPSKGAAWSSVLGVSSSPGAIRRYVDSLTAVMLVADTRVTNHGYRAGKPTAHQSVLQSGTALLIDNLGVPRVRCYCGNPLTPPVLSSGRPKYSGPPWSGFTPDRVVTVQPAAAPIQQITTINVNGGGPLVIAVGGSGGTTTLASPTPAPAPAPAAAAGSPAPAPAPAPSGGEALPPFTPSPQSPSPAPAPQSPSPAPAPQPQPQPQPQPEPVYRLVGFTLDRDYSNPPGFNGQQPGTTSVAGTARSFDFGWTYRNPEGTLSHSGQGNVRFDDLDSELTASEVKRPVRMTVTLTGTVQEASGYSPGRTANVKLTGLALVEKSAAGTSDPVQTKQPATASVTSSTYDQYPPAMSGSRATTSFDAYFSYGDAGGGHMKVTLIYERS